VLSGLVRVRLFRLHFALLLPSCIHAQWSMGAPRDGGTGGALRGGAARMRDTVPRAEYVSREVQGCRASALAQSVTLGRRPSHSPRPFPATFRAPRYSCLLAGAKLSAETRSRAIHTSIQAPHAFDVNDCTVFRLLYETQLCLYGM
jgi:hypothetical protein